jgi:hypothetical protein
MPQLPAQDVGFGDFGGGDSEGSSDGGFGFGDFGSGGGSGGSGFSVDVGGEIGLNLMSYFSDYRDGWDAQENFLSEIWRPGTLSGALDFSASSSVGDAALNLRFNPSGFASQARGESNTPYDNFSNVVALDEAYLRTFIGGFELEAGLRKLSWGRADANGVLDVINASDMSNPVNMTGSKQGNVLLHGAYRLGPAKLEAVFVPVFQPTILPTKGRFAELSGGGMGTMFGGLQAQLGGLIQGTASGLMTQAAGILAGLAVPQPPPLTPEEVLAQAQAQAAAQMQATGLIAQAVTLQNYAGTALMAMLSDPNALAPDTTTLDYFQTGLRFTATLGPVDLGTQYYYGYKPMPALNLAAMTGSLPNVGTALGAASTQADVDAALALFGTPLVYNPYHQIGLDAAFGFWDFNFRLEVAANLTYDMSGDDPAVYNPNLAWHFGFDRELFWDMTAMVMASETITLRYDQIDQSAASMDMEKDSKLTSTSIMLALSKSFLDGDLSIQLAGMVSIENFGYAILPGISWSQGDFTLSLSAGILGGADDSQFGLLKDASFINLGLSYRF